MLLIITLAVQLTLAALLVVFGWGGRLSPTLNYLNREQTLVLLAYMLVTGLVFWVAITAQPKRWLLISVTLSIFLLVAAVGLYTMAPKYKSYTEAQSFNFSQSQDLEYAKQLAQQVRNGEISLDEANQKIIAANKQQDSILKSTFDRIRESEVDTNLQVEIPKVKLTRFTWNCESYGCAYTNGKFVWTTSTNSQVSGAILALSGFALVSFVLGAELRRRT